uniref:TMV resistance protein N n=1 Tax=Quercus lobata TaxID=97700 RepID=A0A7N2MFP0_QUELO
MCKPIMQIWIRVTENFEGVAVLPYAAEWQLDAHEAEVVQKIVQEIFIKLNYTFSVAPDELLGINSRAEKLKSLLAKEPNDVRIIGIWGMGGMGKTTLARVVYGMISNQFEACSFIPNVREKSKKGKLFKLQKRLLEELLMGRDMKIQDVDHGVLLIKDSLRKKKILLILDDVYNSYQLEKLARKNWFGPGSRVLITTRERSLLVTPEVNEIYEIEALNNKEALQLFSLKAFKKDRPDIDYMGLSQAFVDYSQGLPLALEILGSSLCEKSKDEWKSELDKLKEYPKKGINNVLQWSYDGLEETEKEIFLYIALYKKQLWMHDLLQELGRDIVRQESPKAPEKRSKLWLYKDIDKVLTKNMGTKKVQAMVLELSSTKDVDWHPEAFLKMQNLKLLIIDSVHFKHGLKHLPNDLRFLDWRKYPSKSLPSSFESTELVKLCMNCSYIEQLCEGTKENFAMKSLDILTFSGCSKLRRILEFGENMERVSEFYLNGTAITNLPTSIGNLTSLASLSVRDCKNLMSLPHTFFNIKSLENLDLSRCTKLKKQLEKLGTTETVEELNESGIATRLMLSPYAISKIFYLVCRAIKRRIPNSMCLASTSLSGGDMEPYMCRMYDIIAPRSEIPKWFSDRSIEIDVLSDHIWLLYLLPQFYHKEEIKSLSESVANEFNQISIGFCRWDVVVKKCGLRMDLVRERYSEVAAQFLATPISRYAQVFNAQQQDQSNCRKVPRQKCPGVANYWGTLAEMEGGFGYVTKSSAGSLLLFFHMQPNGMQLDQIPGYTAWFLQTCFNNLRKKDCSVLLYRFTDKLIWPHTTPKHDGRIINLLALWYNLNKVMFEGAKQAGI